MQKCQSFEARVQDLVQYPKNGSNNWIWIHCQSRVQDLAHFGTISRQGYRIRCRKVSVSKQEYRISRNYATVLKQGYRFGIRVQDLIQKSRSFEVLPFTGKGTGFCAILRGHLILLVRAGRLRGDWGDLSCFWSERTPARRKPWEVRVQDLMQYQKNVQHLDIDSWSIEGVKHWGHTKVPLGSTCQY